jgi:hypothetical protein
MYSIRDLDGNEIFTFLRPSADRDKIIVEFILEFNKIVKTHSRPKKLSFLKHLLKVIILSEDPTSNFTAIELERLEGNRNLNMYFHFVATRISKSNKLIDARPQLFDDAETYFMFLTSIKLAISSELRILEKGESLRPREQVLKQMFLQDAGLAGRLDKAGWGKLYKRFLSFNPQTKSAKYQPATRDELQAVIKHLVSFPSALALATKALDDLK